MIAASLSHAKALTQSMEIKEEPAMTQETRTETDAFGPIEVDASRYWGGAGAAVIGEFQDWMGKTARTRGSGARHRQAGLR